VVFGLVPSLTTPLRSGSTSARGAHARDGPHAATALADGKMHTAPRYEVEVVDRIGAGDAFSGGLIVSRLEQRDWDEALRFAAATAALKAHDPGDFCLVTRNDVEQRVSREGGYRLVRSASSRSSGPQRRRGWYRCRSTAAGGTACCRNHADGSQCDRRDQRSGETLFRQAARRRGDGDGRRDARRAVDAGAEFIVHRAWCLRSSRPRIGPSRPCCRARSRRPKFEAFRLGGDM